MKNHHDQLFVWIWEQRRICWISGQTANGTECLVPRHSSVRMSQEDHQHQRQIRKVRKRMIKHGGNLFPRKKSRYDHGQPVEAIEPRQLAESNLQHRDHQREQERPNSMLKVIIVSEEAADWQKFFSADVERSLTDWQPYRKRTLKLHLRKVAKLCIQSLVQLRITEQVRRG